jgi:serine/threonine-protein kinase
MSEPTPGALSPGQIFHARYEIVRCLKAGGMGAVYECIHLKTRKRRAIKVMLPQMLADAAMRSRFELEARVTAEIESEHIVETFDAGVDDVTGAPFLVMELLRGEELGSIMIKRGRLPAGEVVALLAQAALALDKTHAAGIVHRDLKPDNLYVTTRDDGSPRLKILDFGIAKVVADVNQTVQRTATIGTPLYMSPEQILGEGTVGPGSDVYAMGHIAFALLTGAAYWADEQKTSPAIFTFLGKVMAGPPEAATARAARRGTALPPAFDAWFVRATARFARDRFESASMLIRELAGVLGAPAPRGASLPEVSADVRAPVPSFASSTPGLAQSAPVAEPSSAPTPNLGAGSTGSTSSNSIKSTGQISRPSRRWVAVLGLGALGVAGLGLLGVSVWSHKRGPTVSPAAIVSAAAAETPIAEAGAPELAPTATPSVTPEPALATVAAMASATAAPGAPLAKPAPIKPAPIKPAPAKPGAPAKDCDPPYVMNSAGHRVMKSQCL